MKIYLAGTSVSNPEEEKEIQRLFKIGHKLHSYYHLFLFEKNWWGKNMKNKVNLFLDSGAFSAKSQGVEINLQEYISFIKEHEDIIEVYANLDVIGDAQATWKNQKIMEQAGLNPVPCYHYGEDEKWLKRYLNKGYKYIALGGLVGGGNSLLTPWLDHVWLNYLVDSEGLPKCKVHGFGLTSLSLMMRYPWYSVDSTSWVITGRLGSVYIPKFRGGEWIYDENSWKISVSNKSPDLKEAGKHIDTLSKKEKEILLNYIHVKGYKLGKSEFKKESQSYELKENEKWSQKKPKDKNEKREVEIIVEEGISNKYQLRDELNIIYFLDLEKSMPEWPWSFQVEDKLQSMF